LVIDQETKRRIIDLYSNEHKTIRDLAKISKKSSRDIVAVLRNSEQNGKAEENKNIYGNIIPMEKVTADPEFDLPPNIKAYKLFSEGRSLVEITIELKLTAQQAQQFNIEYWKLMQMHQLFTIYQEVKNNLGYFLKLFRLGKKEGLTPENIISFLNMADNIQGLSEQIQVHLSEVKNMELRKKWFKEQLEDLENKTMSAQEQLSDTERACKQKFNELSGICSQVQMLEYKIEQYKNSQSYQAIEQIAKNKVSELLADNRKVLEYALVSVIQALRDNPDRYLLIEKISYNSFNSLGTTQSKLYEGEYQFIKENVLELADKIQKDLVDSTLTTGLKKGNLNFREIVEREAGDIAS
jgi:hypothetical protein